MRREYPELCSNPLPSNLNHSKPPHFVLSLHPDYSNLQLKEVKRKTNKSIVLCRLEAPKPISRVLPVDIM